MKTLMTIVTNNFSEGGFVTSSTGEDLKAEIRAEAKKHGKKVTDFKTEPFRA